MRFEDVIGQTQVKQRLLRLSTEHRMPHALLFAGPEGCGKLPAALALAQSLLCRNPNPDGEPCGGCRGCKMVMQWAHPDMHFVFPIVKAESSATSALFLPQWRKRLQESPYFSLQDWFDGLNMENKQALIPVAEAEALVTELSRASSQGGFRVIVIWQADLMNEPMSNKILKILEEPPSKTVFILISEHPERLLPTICSRTQRIDFPPLAVDEMTQALVRLHGLDGEDAQQVAHAAAGNYIKARGEVTFRDANSVFFELFVSLMKNAFLNKVKELHHWAEQVASWNRERQKALLEYMQRLVRENFIYNFQLPELNYLSRREKEFSKNFARFVNERNVKLFVEEISSAQRDVEQNVHARMIFFTFALKMHALLKK